MAIPTEPQSARNFIARKLAEMKSGQCVQISRMLMNEAFVDEWGNGEVRMYEPPISMYKDFVWDYIPADVILSGFCRANEVEHFLKEDGTSLFIKK